MNTTLKLRLSGFVLAIGLLASLIAWAAITSSRRLEESRAKARAGTSESFNITRTAISFRRRGCLAFRG